MIELSIVTGTFNRLSHLQRMIDTARRSLPLGIGYEFVVVDGGSTDGTLDWLRIQPDVRLIEHGTLHGAIRAFNDGAKAAQGRYVILANDDITFIGKSIAIALTHMHDHPTCGIGAFYQDRDGRPMHVNHAPAVDERNQDIRAHYGQVCIIPKWLGDALDWWACGNARTYAGDNCLSARCWEAGYTVDPVQGAQIHDLTPNDDLRKQNNPPEVGGYSTGVMHPDSAEYYRLFPRGPVIKKTFIPSPSGFRKPYRIMYAPIYEPGHPVQRQQKRGLRRALQRIGLVWEVDYVNGEDLVEAAKAWKPDFLLTQFHDAVRFNHEQIDILRKYSAKWANWNGDVHNFAADTKYTDLLKHCDVHLVVNDTAADDYRQAGVNCRYWQVAYEPDGVGIAPDKTTPRHDVLFLANAYSEDRIKLGRFLKQLPCNVGIYGSGWPSGLGNGTTLYDFRRGCQLYQNAKVAISDAGWPNARGFVSNRLFQAMAAGGALVLQQKFDGMEALIGLQNGKHLVTWEYPNDLRLQVIRYVEERDTERRKIAQAGQLEVLRNHSFEARVIELERILRNDTPPGQRDPALANFHEVHNAVS